MDLHYILLYSFSYIYRIPRSVENIPLIFIHLPEAGVRLRTILCGLNGSVHGAKRHKFLGDIH